MAFVTSYAGSETYKNPITQEIDVFRKPYPMVPSLWKIMQEVCVKHKITPLDLVGPSRGRNLIHARRDYCYRARKETNCSLTRIGKSIKRDHTTAIHHINQASAGQTTDIHTSYVNRKFNPMRPISEREQRIYDLVKTGLTSREVGEILGVSMSHVRTIRSVVRRKMEAQGLI